MIDKIQICHYCKEPSIILVKDHIFPKSKIKKLEEKGEPLPVGVDLHDNKVLSCMPCNTNKGNKDYDSFVLLGLKAIKHMKKQFINNQIKNSSRKY